MARPAGKLRRQPPALAISQNPFKGGGGEQGAAPAQQGPIGRMRAAPGGRMGPSVPPQLCWESSEQTSLFANAALKARCRLFLRLAPAFRKQRQVPGRGRPPHPQNAALPDPPHPPAPSSSLLENEPWGGLRPRQSPGRDSGLEVLRLALGANFPQRWERAAFCRRYTLSSACHGLLGDGKTRRLSSRVTLPKALGSEAIQVLLKMLPRVAIGTLIVFAADSRANTGICISVAFFSLYETWQARVQGRWAPVGPCSPPPQAPRRFGVLGSRG